MPAEIPNSIRKIQIILDKYIPTIQYALMRIIPVIILIAFVMTVIFLVQCGMLLVARVPSVYYHVSYLFKITAMLWATLLVLVAFDVYIDSRQKLGLTNKDDLPTKIITATAANPDYIHQYSDNNITDKDLVTTVSTEKEPSKLQEMSNHQETNNSIADVANNTETVETNSYFSQVKLANHQFYPI